MKSNTTRIVDTFDARKSHRSKIERLAGIILFAAIIGGFYYLSLQKLPQSSSATPAFPARKTPAASSQSSAPHESHVSLSAVGDVMMARQVARMIAAKGADEPCRLVAPLLTKADLTVANLESPLSTKGSPLAGKDVVFRGHPAGATGLKNSGVDAVSLANNHALDYGLEALEETVGLLDGHGIKFTGAGPDLTSATQPVYIQAKNQLVAFLAYSSVIPARFYPSETSPGVAPAKSDTRTLFDRIDRARRKGALVVVYFHWGVEYRDYPRADHVDLARRVIDAGADLILGAHPHVIQGIEVYKQKIIAYSLGDFVFDHYSRKTGETFVLQVHFANKQTARAEIIPVYVTAEGQPTLVSGQEAQRI